MTLKILLIIVIYKGFPLWIRENVPSNQKFVKHKIQTLYHLFNLIFDLIS